MKIFSIAQVKEWDKFTIAQEPVTPVDLMERAASACFNWLMKHYPNETAYTVLCGVGNNGGDGLALARMLHLQQCDVEVYILGDYNQCSREFSANYDRLRDDETPITLVENNRDFPRLTEPGIVIDAIFGSGLSRPVEGLVKELAEYVNRSSSTVIAIDMPTGMMADAHSARHTRIIATHTLSFQCWKKAFFMAENGDVLGRVHILDIGLHPVYYRSTATPLEMTDAEMIRHIIRPRNAHSHKGDYGHAALVCGSTGMSGAAVLAARACLRSGVGKLTCHIPKTGCPVIQTAVPAAMAAISGSGDCTETVDGITRYSAIGAGPGIGLYEENKTWLAGLFQHYKKPMVLDADALNLMAADHSLLEMLPPRCILTPHRGEFERLFGPCTQDFERTELALLKAAMLQCYIVLKGRYTFIACPDGKGFFNSTGNPGMATGGSGDVLTGIITGLLAQGHSPREAAVAGVYLHGLAGDLAAAEYSEFALTAGDITRFLGKAFLCVSAAG